MEEVGSIEYFHYESTVGLGVDFNVVKFVARMMYN